MFSKLEMVGAIAISLIGGFAIGYSKAREKCLEIVGNALAEKMVAESENEEEP